MPLMAKLFECKIGATLSKKMIEYSREKVVAFTCITIIGMYTSRQTLKYQLRVPGLSTGEEAMAYCTMHTIALAIGY